MCAAAKAVGPIEVERSIYIILNKYSPAMQLQGDICFIRHYQSGFLLASYEEIIQVLTSRHISSVQVNDANSDASHCTPKSF